MISIPLTVSVLRREQCPHVVLIDHILSSDIGFAIVVFDVIPASDN